MTNRQKRRAFRAPRGSGRGNEGNHRPRVVVVGAGFGGAYCARNLRKKVRSKNVDIVLIDSRNYFIFYPLLIEAGTGKLPPRHVVVSIRSFVPDADFLLGTVSGIDPEARSVHFIDGATGERGELGYDYLVVSPGAVTNLPDVPGLDEFGFSIKSLADAVALRDHAIEMLECANNATDRDARRELLHFVVVGGSFTGVEVAGEFIDFLRKATVNYECVDRSDVGVTLVEIDGRVLPPLSEEMSGYAARCMRDCGIELRLNESVERIERTRVHLSSGDVLSSRTLIWCAGIAPNPLLEKLPFERDERGYIKTARDLRAVGQDRVWAIGDCAANPSPDGDPYPATAQHATLQAQHAAADIARVLRGGGTRPCDLDSRGSLASTGCRTGVANVFGVKLGGFAAWWLFRTVYLFKMPGLARKARVALDWTLDLVFPRDFVALDVTPRRSHKGADNRRKSA